MFRVVSARKFFRRVATSHLPDMLKKARAADLAAAFRSPDEDHRTTAFDLTGSSDPFWSGRGPVDRGMRDRADGLLACR